MKRSSLLLVSGALFVVAVAGCQAIAGISSRTTDPPPPSGCVLKTQPSPGDALLRFVNLATVGTPATNFADFCVRQSGTTDWGRPVFHNGGLDSFCSTGLPYGAATVPLAFPSGKVDVKVIAAGGTCSAPTLSEKDGIAVGDTGGQAASNVPVTTILRYAGGEPASPEALSALPEEPGAFDGQSNHIRFVNALSAGDAVNIGLPPQGVSSLPTTLATPLLASSLAPGATFSSNASVGVGPIDAEGYLRVLSNASISFVASLATDTANKAIALDTLASLTPDTATLFMDGDPADTKNNYPVRGLYCEDRFNQTTTDAGTTPNVPAADLQYLARCTPTKLSTISVDSWDVGLYGANSPYPDQRVAPVVAAIGQRTDTDVICLTEIDGKNYQDAVTSDTTVKSLFPYYYQVDTNASTPPTDPTEKDGTTVPPQPTNPPCGGTVDPTLVQKAYGCLEQNCSTPAGALDGGGSLQQSTDCIISSCASTFLSGLLHFNQAGVPQYTADDTCFDCIILNSLDPTETFATNQDTCTNAVAPAFDFQGQLSILVLSRYPLVNKASYNYPTTGLRRGILKATVQLEDQQVDFFCTQLISPQIDGSLPYIGPYGLDNPSADGGVSENGWEDEQDLQATRAVTWITAQSKADNLPALIAGIFYSTIATPGGGAASDDGGPAVGLGSLSPEVMMTLDNSAGPGGAFTRAEPAGYTRACDRCPENIFGPGEVALEFEPLFLYGAWPSNATASETIWATSNTAEPLVAEPSAPAPAGGTGPLSEYYGHNTQVLRPK